MVQYSIVVYRKIDQKLPLCRVLTIENVTKRSPFFISVPRCVTHVVSTVSQCFPQHFEAKSNGGYKHIAVNSNHISAFGEEEKNLEQKSRIGTRYTLGEERMR